MNPSPHVPRRRWGSPNPATVIALTALVVALGGTATAARTLITSNDIATGAVKARHIAPNAVTLTKIAAPARAALRGAQGPAGAPGVPGVAGVAGVPGPAGGFDLAKLTRVAGAPVTIAPGALGSALASCPTGHKVTGGGFVSAGFQQTLFASAPSIDGTTWIVLLDNTAASVVSLDGSAFALCVAP